MTSARQFDGAAIVSDRGEGKRLTPYTNGLGIPGGIGTHPEDLVHMKRTADRLSSLGDQMIEKIDLNPCGSVPDGPSPSVGDTFRARLRNRQKGSSAQRCSKE
jgi:hypothetical protein